MSGGTAHRDWRGRSCVASFLGLELGDDATYGWKIEVVPCHRASCAQEAIYHSMRTWVAQGVAYNYENDRATRRGFFSYLRDGMTIRLLYRTRSLYPCTADRQSSMPQVRGCSARATCRHDEQIWPNHHGRQIPPHGRGSRGHRPGSLVGELNEKYGQEVLLGACGAR